MAVLRPEHAPTALTSLERRAELLGDGRGGRRAGAAVRPRRRRLDARGVRRAGAGRRRCTPRAVVVGANFRFGHRAAGDVATLREIGASHGFDAEGIALDGGPQVWSSTYVRTCLAAGDVAGAAEALGRPYAVRGVGGRGRPARPRARLPDRQRADRPLTAAPGRRRVRRLAAPARTPASATRPRSASAPTRPSTAQRERRVESYVLDRTDLELYGVEVEVSLRGAAARDGRLRLGGGRWSPRWPTTSTAPASCWGTTARGRPRPTRRRPRSEWFLQHGLSYFVPERRAARAPSRAAAAPGRCRCCSSWSSPATGAGGLAGVGRATS